MKNFIMPDTADSRIINLMVADTLHGHPDIFYDDTNIVGAYGVMANTCFAGGRNTSNENMSDYFIRFYVDQYQQRGMEYRFVFTNSLITEENLSDPVGNMQLKIAEEKNCPVIVYSPVLEEYIRECYPDIRFISSTTKMLTLEQTINELGSDYDIVVLNTELNKRLADIPFELRSKCEVLLNDCCPCDCPYRRDCYKDSSSLNLGIEPAGYTVTYQQDGLHFENTDPCVNPKKEQIRQTAPTHFTRDIARRDLLGQMTYDDLQAAYSLGYQNFKLSGREENSMVSLLMSYAYYLVKPEHQYQFIMDNLDMMGKLDF